MMKSFGLPTIVPLEDLRAAKKLVTRKKPTGVCSLSCILPSYTLHMDSFENVLWLVWCSLCGYHSDSISSNIRIPPGKRITERPCLFIREFYARKSEIFDMLNRPRCWLWKRCDYCSGIAAQLCSHPIDEAPKPQLPVLDLDLVFLIVLVGSICSWLLLSCVESTFNIHTINIVYQSSRYKTCGYMILEMGRQGFGSWLLHMLNMCICILVVIASNSQTRRSLSHCVPCIVGFRSTRW